MEPAGGSLASCALRLGMPEVDLLMAELFRQQGRAAETASYVAALRRRDPALAERAGFGASGAGSSSKRTVRAAPADLGPYLPWVAGTSE